MFSQRLKRFLRAPYFIILVSLVFEMLGSDTAVFGSSEAQKILEDALHKDPITDKDFKKVIWGHSLNFSPIDLKSRRNLASRKKKKNNHRRRHQGRKSKIKKRHVRSRKPVVRKIRSEKSKEKLIAQVRIPDIHCLPNEINMLPQNVSEVQKIIQKMAPNSNTDFNQKPNACGTRDQSQLFIDEARQEYSQLYPLAPRETRQIRGLILEGTREELDAADAIVGSNPPHSWSQSQSICKTVLCALTRTFDDEEAALRALVIRKKFGYNTLLSQQYSYRGRENLWSAVQLRTIESFLKKLPLSVLKRSRLTDIQLFSPELADEVKRQAQLHVRPGGVYTARNPDRPLILINTEGHDSSQGILSVFSHEMGHAFDFGTSPRFSEASGFESMSHWKNFSGGNGQYMANTSGQFVEDYSSTSPIEDFADAFRYYVNHPETLKEIDPAKYAFMREQVFAGQEFSPSGLIQSVPLERAIEARGGYLSILNSCISQLKMHVGSHGELWVNGGTEDEASLKGEVFVQKGSNPCFSQAAVELAHELSPEVDVCQFGGAPGIEEHLKAKLDYSLEKILRTAAQRIEEQWDESTRSCIQELRSPQSEDEIVNLIVSRVRGQCR